jgi:hypothetical protein
MHIDNIQLTISIKTLKSGRVPRGKPLRTGRLGRLEGEETESSGAVKLNCGRMQCAPTDEFTVVLREDLRGFKNLGGLVGIIGVTRTERRQIRALRLSIPFPIPIRPHV